MRLCLQYHPEGKPQAVGRVKYFISNTKYQQLKADLSPSSLAKYNRGWNVTGDFCQKHLDFMIAQLSGEGYKIKIEKFSETTTEGAQRKKRGGESF